jgi:hypothetical protein
VLDLTENFSEKPTKINDHMEDKELKKFSLTALLFVTGISFFIFSKALWLIDGIRLPLFNWIGVIAVLSGSLNMIFSMLIRSKEK